MTAPTITSTQFRIDFPEFADLKAFPDSQVNFWLGNATLFFNQRRWVTWLNLGMELFTAHQITLEAKTAAEAANGTPPGQTTGPISSKSVDKVSVGYDTSNAVEADGGHWNMTIYGTRLLRMMKLVGAGPLQVGIGHNPNPLNGPAWSGPDCAPSFTGFGN